jgi:SPP1 gp7 family putative phage head morphogenesis protein
MSSEKDRENFLKKLDEVLKNKVELPFLSKLKAYFKSVITLITANTLSLLKTGRLSIPVKKQTELENILQDYFKDTSKKTVTLTKDELKQIVDKMPKWEEIKAKKKPLPIPPGYTEEQKKQAREIVTKLPSWEEYKKAKKEKKLPELINVEETKKAKGKIDKIEVPNLTNQDKNYIKQLSGKELSDLQAKVKNDLFQALQENPELTLREAKKKIIESGQAFTDARIDNILRTEGTRIANERRLETFEKSRIIQGVQFLAVLDNRTTDYCQKRHRAEFRLDDPNLRRYNTPPLHYRCRSLLSPITIYEEFNPLSGEQVEALPPPMKGFGKFKTG